MSRCFPFPPPGYILNGIRDEALIESIKGAEEKAKKEQRRKERKREKKDKNDKKDKKAKKEKKEKKRKERERGDGESEKHRHKRRHKEEGAKDSQNQKVDVFRKLKERENDCLEKSSLTVERELLPSTSQNSCDSTVNSNELPKQKEKQPLDGRRNNDSESIIRIRLPLRRLKDPELMTMTNNDQQKLCPSRETKLDTSQRDTREQPVKQQQPCSTSAPGHASKPLEEKRRDHVFTTKLAKEKKFKPTSQETFQPSSLCRICPPSMAVQFLNVVENWVPSTIERRVELINSEDEECWWSMNKPSSHNFGTERCKQLSRNNETKEVISSSVAWPRARLLLEADVHALPYTVPF
ncbi:glutamic acid-rich protein isoform X1 [Eutrema salsugineum]|uniref:glutamic acid-rich protein isoform X1 n=1 Tax=Eutrema salsugineum TaxID=72664 RepID=UPI000CED2FA2|nr:glutamic acid-rich protein isoform X1 [Eutrema salsugineum]